MIQHPLLNVLAIIHLRRTIFDIPEYVNARSAIDFIEVLQVEIARFANCVLLRLPVFRFIIFKLSTQDFHIKYAREFNQCRITNIFRVLVHNVEYIADRVTTILTERFDRHVFRVDSVFEPFANVYWK